MSVVDRTHHSFGKPKRINKQLNSGKGHDSDGANKFLKLRIAGRRQPSKTSLVKDLPNSFKMNIYADLNKTVDKK